MVGHCIFCEYFNVAKIKHDCLFEVILLKVPDAGYFYLEATGNVGGIITCQLKCQNEL